MIPRTISAIRLGPSDNTHGAFFFMNINTGCRLHAHSWTALSMLDDVIERVDELGHKQTMLNMVNGPVLNGALAYRSYHQSPTMMMIMFPMMPTFSLSPLLTMTVRTNSLYTSIPLPPITMMPMQ